MIGAAVSDIQPLRDVSQNILVVWLSGVRIFNLPVLAPVAALLSSPEYLDSLTTSLFNSH